MVGAQLVAYFMYYIVYIEIISLRNSISRRSDTASFLSVYTNATDTTGISTTAGSAKHVPDIIIGVADHISSKDSAIVHSIVPMLYKDLLPGRKI